MKNAFIIGIILVFVIVTGGLVWLFINYLRAECIQTLMTKCRFLGILAALFPLLSLLILLKYNVTSVLIAAVHLFVLSLITKAALTGLGRLFRFSLRNDVILGIGFLLTALVLILGFINMRTVRKTEYTVTTNKPLPGGSIRIAMISDVHLSTCIDGDRFMKVIDEISEFNPDMLLICGDLVDESSRMSELEKACSALKTTPVSGGIWFVFGNHDNGIYGKREISREALKCTLENAGVGILEDSAVGTDCLTIIGRKDASDRNRADASALFEKIPDETFSILLDHQPTDYENEAGAGFDLVLSGHTHGGQMFPAGAFGMLLGANDLLYGTERRNGTTFIVSSGVSGWALPFKTGCVSEYVIIDVQTVK